MDIHYIKHILDYKDGHLIWKNKTSPQSRITIGSLAGGIRSDGYMQIMIKRKAYLLHRIVWIWHNGNIEEDMVIDHKNNIRNDNRIENLQLLPQSKNIQKQKIRKNNTSGYKGVSFYFNKKKWVASIHSGNNRFDLGSFDCPKEAAMAYNIKAIELHGNAALINIID